MNKSTLPVFSLTLCLVVMFTLGLGVRLLDLTDPPLDFNPTRQLRSAIIARGLYLAGVPDADPVVREQAVSFMHAMERLEPRILETIVAAAYHVMGGENLWISRVFSSVSWLVGAGVLYDLGRRTVSPWAAFVGVGYYLFLPFSIRGSRSFQPDPVMVMFILLTAWALFRYSEASSRKWVWIAGVFGGLAVLIKATSVFFVFPMAIAVFTYVSSDRKPYPSGGRDLVFRQVIFHPQAWILVLLIVSPALLYYSLGSGDGSSGNFVNWTVISRWREVLDPSFFMRWMIRVDDIFMAGLILAGLVGSLVATRANRALLLSLWGGYFLFGIFFPYHILTHDYYHLPLVGLVGLSLVPLVGILWQEFSRRKRIYQIAGMLVLIVFFSYNGWIGRSILLGQDFRDHPAYWQEVGEAIPTDGKAIGLTQDYGFRLMYYGWRKIALWPSGAGSEDFEKNAAGASYFVITAKNRLTEDLGSYLESNFQTLARENGYQIYDLRQPK